MVSLWARDDHVFNTGQECRRQANFSKIGFEVVEMVPESINIFKIQGLANEKVEMEVALIW